MCSRSLKNTAMKQVYLLFIIIFAAVSDLSAQKTEYKEFSIRDPFSYKTAAEMYAVTDTLPYSSTIDPIINKITENINNEKLIENDAVWSMLQKLEPYRMNHKVQKAVEMWVEKTAENILKKKSNEVSLKTLKLICADYKAKNFSQVVQKSKKELLSDPASPDLRNNFALALIHLKQDLCAQIELEILSKLFENYPAGLLNLVVVYERMNRSEDAETLAKKLYLLQFDNNIDIPEARFNAAWLMNKKGEYETAEYILANPNPLKNANISKYDSLRILNLREFDQELNK
jgi:hypothetical protein